MALTPDKKKTATVGVGLSLFGLATMLWGSRLFSAASQGGNLFGNMLMMIFGALLTLSSLLVFVMPAAVDYLHEAMHRDEIVSE